VSGQNLKKDIPREEQLCLQCYRNQSINKTNNIVTQETLLTKKEELATMAFHICYPLRADQEGNVYCKHCDRLIENQKKKWKEA